MAALEGYEGLTRRLTAIGDVRLGEKVMKRIALETVREAKLKVRRKTGNLGRSIHIQSVTATGASVQAGARYAGFIEFGTRPHEIRPVHGKVLAWPTSSSDRRLTGSARKTVKGGWTFAKVVHHPGTKAYPFLLPAARDAVKRAGLSEEIVAAWNSAD